MVCARPRHRAESMSLDSTEPYRRYVATDKARIRDRCSPLAPSVRWLESPSRVVDERGADLAPRGAGRSRLGVFPCTGVQLPPPRQCRVAGSPPHPKPTGAPPSLLGPPTGAPTSPPAHPTL